MTSKIWMGLVIALASATVGQVWLVQTPNMAGIRADQLKDQADIKYIRDKVDKIYDEVKK